ncbi:MAG TPA: hypothetical protein VHU83_02245 [Bryobacteraceae bacterium]|nr:hypothetical protein [Bryobacteraceae bacterium]
MLKTAIAGLAVVLALPLVVMAQRHPGYLHALSDLRYARALLEHGEWGRVGPHRERAIGEIDRAIDELRRAAMDDGRNPNEHPPVQESWGPRDRLRRTEEALGRARDSISREEDNPAARQWRDRAFHHIDEARRAVHEAIEAWR